jgi:hypothetical protein
VAELLVPVVRAHGEEPPSVLGVEARVRDVRAPAAERPAHGAALNVVPAHGLARVACVCAAGRPAGCVDCVHDLADCCGSG